MTAMKVKISSGRKVEAVRRTPWRVISGTEKTEPSEEYLISVTKLVASGGRTRRTACGSTMRVKVCQDESPTTCAASRCPAGTAWIPARNTSAMKAEE